MDQQNSDEENERKDKKWPTGTGMGMGIAIRVAIGAAVEAQLTQAYTTPQKNIRINSILIGVGVIVFGLFVGNYPIFSL